MLFWDRYFYQKNKLFLGGEGMIGTADGYTDFLRMLLNHGKLNGYRFLNESSVKEIYSPHTQLDNEYGYNGYNLWVTSKKSRELGHGDEGLWSGGGYEGTHFWIDPKRDFVGLIMTQMFETPRAGHGRDNEIRGEVYKQIFKKCCVILCTMGTLVYLYKFWGEVFSLESIL